jgi:hypothetical protein
MVANLSKLDQFRQTIALYRSLYPKHAASVNILILGDLHLNTIQWNTEEKNHSWFYKTSKNPVFSVDAKNIISPQFNVYSMSFPGHAVMFGSQLYKKMSGWNELLVSKTPGQNKWLELIAGGKSLSQALSEGLHWPKFDLVFVSGLGFWRIVECKTPKEHLVPELFDCLAQVIRQLRSDFNVPIIWTEPWHVLPSSESTGNGISKAVECRKYFDEYIRKQIPDFPPWLMYGKLAPEMSAEDFVCNGMFWKIRAAAKFVIALNETLRYIYGQQSLRGPEKIRMESRFI